MKYWQKARNYRKYEREDGMFVYLITVDGEDVEVSAEVYQAYSQADRRERYQAERDAGLVLSLNKLAEDEMQLSYLTDKHIESAEDATVLNVMTEQLRSVLHLMEADEMDLILCLYTKGVSIREYARQKGLSDFAIRHRERKVLIKLKKLLEK
jgi:DNA-directed RNA polymerase sigma subunit (sigma70/sigma32)